MPDDVNILDSEDTDTTHLPKIKTIPDWLKPLPEEDRPKTTEPYWIIPSTYLPEAENNWANALANDTVRTAALSISKLKAANYPDFGLEELVPSLWIKSKRDYNISATYGITHWWFERKDFYITRHNAPSDHHAFRCHMQVLSVISIKTFESYGYAFLKEIVIRRADYNEDKISEVDFKNLHSNDFEDLKPRAGIYKDRNDQKKMLRENEVHKFNHVNISKSSTNKAFHTLKDSLDLESSLDYFHKLFTPHFIIHKPDSLLHAQIVL
nr:hypothetical protein [Tanacetum cinerariifolium]